MECLQDPEVRQHGGVPAPSEDEIEAAAGKLRQAGIGGWFAVMDGSYFGRRRATLHMVREIVPIGGRWERAVAAFKRARRETTAPPRLDDPITDPR
jgi:hypothetical protein